MKRRDQRNKPVEGSPGVDILGQDIHEGGTRGHEEGSPELDTVDSLVDVEGIAGEPYSTEQRDSAQQVGMLEEVEVGEKKLTKDHRENLNLRDWIEGWKLVAERQQ